MTLSRRQFAAVGIHGVMLERFLQSKVTLANNSQDPGNVPVHGAAQTVAMANSVTTLLSPFCVWWNDGGRAFAASLGLAGTYSVMENQGKLEKVLDQINKYAESAADQRLLNIDLGTRYSAQAVAKLCVDKKIYVVTHGIDSIDATTAEFAPYYVAHMAGDHIDAGEKAGLALLSAAGTRASIFSLEGPRGDAAATQRKDGLDRALAKAPQARLLPSKAADWNASSAFELTKLGLSSYHGKIDGIWAANDKMALGAIEALRVHNLVNKIPVVGIDGDPAAFASIQDGELTATVPQDAFFEGGVGLSLAYAASAGKLPPAFANDEHRHFYVRTEIVTRDNVAQYLSYRTQGAPSENWNDFQSRLSKPVLR